MSPQPVLPNFGGPAISGIIPAILGPGGTRALPDWFPAPVRDARQVVLLVVDGLGWNQLLRFAHLAPRLSSMVGGPITTVAPSTTATALTSITTGLPPSEHGIVGYRMAVEGEVLNVLRWCTPAGDARTRLPPAEMQPHRPFLGHAVPVVSRVELESSAFTEAHLRGSVPVGWRMPSNIAVEIRRQLDAGAPVVYAYYDGLDKIAHACGFGPYYDAELVSADRLVGDVIDALPAGSALLVTADHGQVHIGDACSPPAAEVLALARGESGEGRFRWLHARPGAARALAEAAREAHGDVAWVVSREQVVDEGWLGPNLAGPVAARLGDVALVAHAPVSFDAPADTGPYVLIGRHGSLTEDEMLVPLVAASA